MREASVAIELIDDGERVTAEQFAGLGFRGRDYFLHMHGGDATEGSIDFLQEEGDRLEQAILSGRKPQGKGRLGRGKEMRGLSMGLELALTERFGSLQARLIAPAISEQTARRQIEDVAKGIEKNRPY